MKKWNDSYCILIFRERKQGKLSEKYKIITNPFWYNLVGYFYDADNYGYDKYWFPGNGIEAWSTRDEAVACLLEYVPEAEIVHLPLDLQTGI